MQRSFRLWAALAALIGVFMLATVPLVAQTATPVAQPEGSELVLITGPVDVSTGSLMVGEFVLVPSGAVLPPLLRQGDVVIVTGYLLADGVTVLALTVELFLEDIPEVTLEVTLEPSPEVTPEITPEATPEATPELTPEPTPDVSGCEQPNHPVALAYAREFGVSYEEIISWRCLGFGYGEIARAYLLAYETGADPSDYFEQRAAGMGWGQIVQQEGVHPAQLAPGRVIAGRAGGPPWLRAALEPTTEPADEAAEVQPQMQADETGRGGPPPFAGPPAGRGSGENPGGGPPPFAGPPEGRGPGQNPGGGNPGGGPPPGRGGRP
ncbi:MAG: hypothetical protein SNJ59_12695 [Aggregatilineales bacterium]